MGRGMAIFLWIEKSISAPKTDMHTLWPVLKSLGVFSGSETGRVYKEILSFKDYGIFCSFLWPMMEKYMDMTLGRELLSDFLAKDAQFNVYIGLGSGPDFAITMKAEAVYDDRVCPLAKINEPTVGYRNWEAERHMVRLLYKYFVCEDDLYPGTGVCRSDDDIVRLLNEGIDDLNQYAQVFVDERVRKIKVISAARLNVGVSIRSGILDFDVRANDMSWEEIREALKAYRRKKKYFRLRNGDFIDLGNDGLAVVSRLAKDMSVDLNTVSDGSIQVPVFRSGYVDKVLSEAQEHIELHKSRDFRKLIRELGHYEKTDFEVPGNLENVLRTYQKEGFRWLVTLDSWGLGGILADDMGLEKPFRPSLFWK